MSRQTKAERVEEIAAIERELRELADTLDSLEPQVTDAQARRLVLWKRGRKIGLTSVELGGWSRRDDVTVRRATNEKKKRPRRTDGQDDVHGGSRRP